MEDPDRKNNWLWSIVVVFLFLILIVWFLNPVGEVPPTEPPAVQQPDPNYTLAPEGGVPVQLPDTPVTSVPVEAASPEVSAAS